MYPRVLSCKIFAMYTEVQWFLVEFVYSVVSGDPN